MPLPPSSAQSLPVANTASANPVLHRPWQGGTVIQTAPPLRAVGNAPLTASGVLALPALRQHCREAGVCAMIHTAMETVRQVGFDADSTHSAGTLGLAIYALADAAPLPSHPGPLDLSHASTADVQAHAAALTAYEHSFQLAAQQAVSLSALARAIALSNVDFAGKQGFLECAAELIQRLHTPAAPSAIDMTPGALMASWHHWQLGALRHAMEDMWCGLLPDYRQLWANYALEAATADADDIRGALWCLAIEGFPQPGPSTHQHPRTTADFTGPLMDLLRQGNAASTLIDRFMVTDPTLAQWIRQQCQVVRARRGAVDAPDRAAARAGSSQSHGAGGTRNEARR